MESREEEDEVGELELVREKALSKSLFEQMLHRDAAQLRAFWDAFGAFCEEKLGVSAEEVLRANYLYPEANPLLKAVLEETAEAAEDAEDTADWRRLFSLSWRAR